MEQGRCEREIPTGYDMHDSILDRPLLNFILCSLFPDFAFELHGHIPLFSPQSSNVKPGNRKHRGKVRKGPVFMQQAQPPQITSHNILHTPLQFCPSHRRNPACGKPLGTAPPTHVSSLGRACTSQGGSERAGVSLLCSPFSCHGDMGTCVHDRE